MSACFLIISAEVLDSTCYALGMETFQLGGSHLARKERILGEILKVSTVERVTVNVHAGAKETLDLICHHFTACECKQLAEQLTVECGSKQSAVRQAECLCAAVKAHTRRTVIAAGTGNAHSCEPV